MISMITACTEEGIIGLKGNNKMLWHCSDDLKRFKKLTEGQTVVMGRATLDSMGRALPNRLNVVLTRDSTKVKEADNIQIVSSLPMLLKMFSNFIVIGGEEIYKLLLPLANEVLVTTIPLELEDPLAEKYARFDLATLTKDFIQVSQEPKLSNVSNKNVDIVFSKWQRESKGAK